MLWSLFIFRGHSTREPASVVCNDEQRDLVYSAGPHRNRRERFGEKKNTREWTGRVKISKEEISGSKCRMCGYTLTYSRL